MTARSHTRSKRNAKRRKNIRAKRRHPQKDDE